MVNGDPVVYLKRWYEQYRWQSTRLKVWYVKKISFDGWLLLSFVDGPLKWMIVEGILSFDC